MKWISVEDDVPSIMQGNEFSETILITDGIDVCSGYLWHWGDDDLEFDIRYGGAGFESDTDQFEPGDVTHRMPYPDPPSLE